MTKTSLILKTFTFVIFATASVARAQDTHSGGARDAVVVNKKAEKDLKKCVKNFTKTALKVCKKFKAFDLSPKEIQEARKMVADLGKSDNHRWTDERVAEAKKFLDSYLGSSSTFRVSRELWCTLGAEAKDEKEKSLSFVNERCQSKRLREALAQDLKGLDEVAYMLGSLSGVGLDRQAKAAAQALKIANTLGEL